MQALIALVAGLLFGIGLLLSGMANPTKVIGFLDLAGSWDPSLALVMAGAIGAALPAFTMARKRSTAWAGCALALPSATQIDAPLVLGSLTFGVGWGLAGYCPGPALVSLGTGSVPAVVFVLAMIAGMAIHAWLTRPRA
ncbi:MAG: hypothetical protein NVV69_20215 [Methyloversatilis sp.]|jgi:uncharacterized membrane protein YedE/YeeE|uniref:DUF6691 family protein n=2 Tax=Methyloversatilis TaxID=378210 RepID=UPI0025E84176|nr:DUF6691 family protein [Methyloversatilis sp.]MCR6668282.1 hypothetical protein [Methyloversatilis sp.]